MDELQHEEQKFDSKISLKSLLILLNIVITYLAIQPVYWLNQFFYHILLNNKEEFLNQHNFMLEGVVCGLPIIVWIVSIIFSIQGLIHKKLGKLKTIYLILSFILILTASLYSLSLLINVFPD